MFKTLLSCSANLLSLIVDLAVGFLNRRLVLVHANHSITILNQQNYTQIITKNPYRGLDIIFPIRMQQ